MWIYIFTVTQCSPCLWLVKTINLHNYLRLAKSRGVNGHVNIPFDIGHFLLVVFRTKPPSPAFLEILGHKDNEVTTLTFVRNVTSSVTWPFDSSYTISYWCSIVTKLLSPAFLEILGPKDNWVTTLTFLGHVTSSVMWPFDSPYPISCRRSIVTKPLSPSLLEILDSKDNCVTTLTFLGHVTSVTWPFVSPCPISYWCSIVTKPLSLIVFETLGSKVPVLCKSSLRMRDITRPVPPVQNLGTHWNLPTPHCLLTMTLLYGSDKE